MELSAILDSTKPDLTAFQKRGGKLIVVIGTNDTLAPPGAQLDYYQSVLDKLGRPAKPGSRSRTAKRTSRGSISTGCRSFWVFSTGGHEWANWRRYLYQSAQIMFRDCPPKSAVDRHVPPNRPATMASIHM